MKPVILFRVDLDCENEAAVAQRHFAFTRFRSGIEPGSLVIGRYSVLPFYRELEEELIARGSAIINSFQEHSYIADVTAWAMPGGALHGMTPRTWETWGNLPVGKSFVVKGKTNSRKHAWNTRMFAPTAADVPRIAGSLLDDYLLAEQGLVVREYVPLRKLDEGINGLPITNEWRTFWLTTSGGPVMLARGYYWASHPESAEKAEWTDAAEVLAVKAAVAVSEHASFFVLDLAQTETGEWIVIEVNDGQMSGLSMIDPHELYANLAENLRGESASRHAQ